MQLFDYYLRQLDFLINGATVVDEDFDLRSFGWSDLVEKRIYKLSGSTSGANSDRTALHCRLPTVVVSNVPTDGWLVGVATRVANRTKITIMLIYGITTSGWFDIVTLRSPGRESDVDQSNQFIIPHYSQLTSMTTVLADKLEMKFA